MNRLSLLKAEVGRKPEGCVCVRDYLMGAGFAGSFDAPAPIARARAIESLFTGHAKHLYENDLVAGSIRGLFLPVAELDPGERERFAGICASFGRRSFVTNADHFAPDYETLLREGVGGVLGRIARAKKKYAHDPDREKSVFLEAAEISMRAFGEMIRGYGQSARAAAEAAKCPGDMENFSEISKICDFLLENPPETFRQALQLIWFAHTAFLYEGRYAMALGRLDQYLYPFYRRDLDGGVLTEENALALLECTLYKIGEYRFFGGDDVVNIAIAGLRPDGSPGLNPVSYLILRAVKNCNIPGPNLSARLYPGIPDDFLDECLRVIGTGLGYPALMNDEVNIPALARWGYDIEDCRNYSMVGCIENFITGKQPPWSDGRYNSPKFLELALNNGRCMLTGVLLGPETGEPGAFASMEAFLAAVKTQMEYGAAEYMARFRNENGRYNRIAYTEPFLSCFCADCIDRGRDINNGGAVYPSVHGAGCMGIATVADSLAAVETLVFREKKTDMETLRRALAADFEGYGLLRSMLIKAPKYGNADETADKYARWFVETHDEIFSKYRTWDKGGIYTAIASNISNIPAGTEVAATPDGRRSRAPLSDAASPAQGADKNGPTAAVLSLTSPDYTRVSCGTVVNQKYSPEMFSNPENRAALLALVKIYFQRGGQELQINSVSREILEKAMENPGEYKNLVVRVSGFSAYFVNLSKEVQRDILLRTEQA